MGQAGAQQMKRASRLQGFHSPGSFWFGSSLVPVVPLSRVMNHESCRRLLSSAKDMKGVMTTQRDKEGDSAFWAQAARGKTKREQGRVNDTRGVE